MTEQEKMLAHQWYDVNADKLLEERSYAERLCWQYNQCSPEDIRQKKEILSRLLGKRGINAVILAPIQADYGSYTRIGADTFINHGAYFMDGGTITIGQRCQIGPNCGMYTAAHPMIAQERATGFEKAMPIVIEDDVWISGDVTILGGVTIGKGSVIGAKSLVSKDVPANSIAAGIPARVVRTITEEDSVKDFLKRSKK